MNTYRESPIGRYPCRLVRVIGRRQGLAGRPDNEYRLLRGGGFIFSAARADTSVAVMPLYAASEKDKHGKFHQWQDVCLRALVEPQDSPRLAHRVKEAGIAIRRPNSRTAAAHAGNPERRRLADGVRSLRQVRTESFKFSTIGNLGQGSGARRVQTAVIEVCEK